MSNFEDSTMFDEDYFNHLNVKFKKFDNDLPHMNNWEYVKDGRLCPVQELRNKHPHIHTYRIPLMLKTIGFGQPLQNYKLVPLQIFGQLTIIITLNPDAFFVPVNITEHEYFGINNKKFELDTVEPTNNYVVSSISLHTEQYRFDRPEIHNMLMEKVREGGFVMEFTEFEILERNMQKMTPTMTFTRSMTRNSIKAVHVIFQNTLYKYSKYARKLSRLNIGIKSMHYKQSGAQYPLPTQEEYNSLNSHGKKNAQFFWNELAKSIGRSPLEGNTVMSLTSFCIGVDTSHMIGFLHHSKKVNYSHMSSEYTPQIDYKGSLSLTDNITTYDYYSKSVFKYVYDSSINSLNGMDAYRNISDLMYTKFNGDVENIQSKCIYTLTFQTSPRAEGLYRTGIDTNLNTPFIIEIQKVDDLESSHSQKLDQIMYAGAINTIAIYMFELNIVARLDQNGEFLKTAIDF